MRSTIFASLILLAGCFQAPTYVGRLCSDEDPCPGGLICVEARCSDRLAEPDATVDAGIEDAVSAPDALPDATLFPDATTMIDDDAGVDAGIDAGSTPTVVQISTRNKHDLVLLSDGTLYAWGWNEHGQVEGAPYTDRRSPLKVPLENVIRVAAGGVMSFALTSDGVLHSWGRNRSGELGDGTFGTETSTAIGVVRGPNGVGNFGAIRDIAAGYDFALVLLEDGTVWSFGSNAVSQLGRSDVTYSTVPVQVEWLDHVEKIAAGAYHGVALKSDHTVWAWGYNDYGQLGRGAIPNSIAVAEPVHGENDIGVLEDIIDISAGWGHTLAVDRGGSVYSWGWDASGQLGDDLYLDRAYPAVVLNTSGLAALSNIVEVKAGFTFSMARTASQDLYAFGFNMYAQLGDGTSMTRSLPAPVILMNGVPIGGVIAFGGGADNAIAITRDQTIWTWGTDVFGELGDGTMRDVSAPFPQTLTLPF